jgi:hypothetical protein
MALLDFRNPNNGRKSHNQGISLHSSRGTIRDARLIAQGKKQCGD